MSIEANKVKVQTQQVIPPSIQQDMKQFGKTDVAEINIGLIQNSVETAHSPEKGIFSGLDGDEIAILTELNPELKDQYEAMANSDINKENLQNDINVAASRLEKAKENYESVSKNANNWFLNIFRSKETKEQLQKDVENAQTELNYANTLYEGYGNNVISYETILQRNGGMEFNN